MVRYLIIVDHNARRITRADKDFAKNPDFKNVKFSVKIRNIHKIEKKNSTGISAFGYENKEKQKNMQFMYQNMLWRKTCWLITDRRRKKKTLWFYQRF